MQPLPTESTGHRLVFAILVLAAAVAVAGLPAGSIHSGMEERTGLEIGGYELQVTPDVFGPETLDTIELSFTRQSGSADQSAADADHPSTEIFVYAPGDFLFDIGATYARNGSTWELDRDNSSQSRLQFQKPPDESRDVIDPPTPELDLVLSSHPEGTSLQVTWNAEICYSLTLSSTFLCESGPGQQPPSRDQASLEAENTWDADPPMTTIEVCDAQGDCAGGGDPGAHGLVGGVNVTLTASDPGSSAKVERINFRILNGSGEMVKNGSRSVENGPSSVASTVVELTDPGQYRILANATDTVGNTPDGHQTKTIDVRIGAPSELRLQAPSGPVESLDPFTVTGTAVDADGNRVPSENGTKLQLDLTDRPSGGGLADGKASAWTSEGLATLDGLELDVSGDYTLNLQLIRPEARIGPDAGSIANSTPLGVVHGDAVSVALDPGAIGPLSADTEAVDFAVEASDKAGNEWEVASPDTTRWSVQSAQNNHTDGGRSDTINATGVYDPVVAGGAREVRVKHSNETGSIHTANASIAGVESGDLDAVRIDDADSGEIGNVGMTADDALDLVANGYDKEGNRLDPVPVQWTVTDPFADASLDDSHDGTTATFEPQEAGTGRIEVTNASAGVTDATGDVTVDPGALADIRIENASGGEIGDVEMTTDDSLKLFARGYDAEGNLRGEVPVDWHAHDLESLAAVDNTTNVTFAPEQARTSGNIIVNHTGLAGWPDDATGTINVSVGEFDHVRIRPITRPEFPDNGSLLQRVWRVPADETLGLAAYAVDADGNRIGPANVNWSREGDVPANRLNVTDDGHRATYDPDVAGAVPAVTTNRSRPNATPLTEGFEQAPTGWTLKGLWHVTEGRNQTGSKAIWFGDEDTGTYEDGSSHDASAVTPEFTVPRGAPVVAFRSWYETEGPWRDRRYVEVSADDGQTWETLEGIHNGYDYPQYLRTWQTEGVSLSEYEGESVQLRFRFVAEWTYLNSRNEGWYIDNVAVVDGQSAVALSTVHGDPVNVTVAPSRVETVTAGDRIQFEATATDVDGNLWDATESSYWSAEDPKGFMFEGDYRAAKAGGPYNITAEIGDVEGHARVINVTRGPMEAMRIHDANGTEIGHRQLAADENLTLRVQAYDGAFYDPTPGNPLDTVSNASSLRWNVTGGLNDSRLTVADNRTQATYDPVNAGANGTIRVRHLDIYRGDSTGLIAVFPGEGTRLVFRKMPETAEAGETFNITTELRDENGNTPAQMPNASLSLASAPEGVETGVVNRSEAPITNPVDWRLSLNETGNYTFQAEAGGVASKGSPTLRVEPAPLARLVINASTETLAVDTEISLDVTGLDAHNNAIPIEPTWSTTCGAIDQDGTYHAPKTPGKCDIQVSNRSRTGQLVKASLQMEIRPGPAARIPLTCPAKATVATDVTCSAHVEDKFGNDHPDASVSLSARTDSGGLLDVTGTGNITLPKQTSAGPVTVAATYQGLANSTTIALQPGQRTSIMVVNASSGTELGSARLRLNETLNLTAVGVDAFGNPIRNVSAAWTVSDGAVASLNASSGSTVTVEPEGVGSTSVSAEHASGATDKTGTINVVDADPPSRVLGVTSPTHTAGGWSAKTTLEVTWQAASDDDGIEGYSYVLSSDQATPDATLETPSTKATVTIPSEGRYTFRVAAVDASGNVGPPGSFGPIRIDGTPPSVPNLVLARPLAGGDVEITWSASTDNRSGVEGYRLLKAPAGEPLSPVTDQLLTDRTYTDPKKATSDGTKYTYSVQAVDSVGLSSAKDAAKDTVVADHDENFTTPSAQTLDALAKQLGASPTELAAKAVDDDGDGRFETLEAVEGVRLARTTTIDNQTVMLLTSSNANRPKALWAPSSGQVAPVTPMQGELASVNETESGNVRASVQVTKSGGWIYVNVSDPRPDRSLLKVTTTDNRTLSMDRVWREEGEIVFLDDPTTTYHLIFAGDELTGGSMTPWLIAGLVLVVVVAGAAVIFRDRIGW